MPPTTTAEESQASGASGRRAHAAPRRRRRGLIEWLIIVIVALAAAFLIRTYLIESYVVPTGSMEPTIEPNDRILVNKLSFDFGNKPKLGDIVVFHESPADTTSDTPILVKRLIGLPGQRLQSGPNGAILVDGKPINQPWLTASTRANPGPNICSPGATYSQTDCRDGVLYLPPNEYYVMGDNRDDSDDSRYWGPISGKLLIGRAFVRIWPLGRIHWF